MAEELKNQFEDPQIHTLDSDERISRLILAESEVRNTKKFNRIIQQGKLRYPEASVNLQLLEAEGVSRGFIERLAVSEWISEGKDLLITGKTGTGKSYCACALAIAAAVKFKTIRYFKASELLRHLQSAENSRTMTEELNKLAKIDLLIIDDFGLMSLDMDMCRNLFELIDSREGRKSTIIVSQFPVAEWYEMFKDSTYADACLDRLTGGSLRIEFTGESLRRRPGGE